jgi:hypothetical protein
VTGGSSESEWEEHIDVARPVPGEHKQPVIVRTEWDVSERCLVVLLQEGGVSSCPCHHCKSVLE